MEFSEDEIELAQRLLREWDEGRGLSKSQLEIKTWGDATSHGRHFDRLVRGALGVSTSRPSKQSDRIRDLEMQVRTLGGQPVGLRTLSWEIQLQHGRDACLAALRVWNDPLSRFRTGSFSLLFVTAWNSLAAAIIERAQGEWRKTKPDGSLKLGRDREEQSRETMDLMSEAFAGAQSRGLRENVRFWVDLRNATAHRHLPALDYSVIPYAQAGLLNIEDALTSHFGPEFSLAESLSIPLQLSGFHDPGVLSSRKKLLAALPIGVQSILSRAETVSPELVKDQTFMLRVAFVPVVPASGRGADAVAYFVKPGTVPTELADALDNYVVLPKTPLGSRPSMSAMAVIAEVERRTGRKLNTKIHADAARKLGARSAIGEPDTTVNLQFAEYITSFKRYLYSQAWVDTLVAKLSTEAGFTEIAG